MADLASEFLGIRSPNPFWLASAPPTDKAYNVNRAFEAGWGGAVWKTLGEDPPIVNVSGPRYSAIHGNDRRVIGFNNSNDLLQPLTRDWNSVVAALRGLKRSGGTNLAAGIQTAVDELERNGREDSSRVIVLS